MADYINKNILCQAYLHLDSMPEDETALSDLKIHLTKVLREKAQFFIYPEAEVDLEFREGSLKIYGTILGTLTSAYVGVSQYGDFRKSSVLLYEDAKRVSEYVVAESLYSTNSRHGQIIHLEARTGVIGSVKKIVTDLEAIKHMDSSTSLKAFEPRLKSLHDDLDKLFDNLKSPADIHYVATGILGILDGFPDTPNPSPAPNRRPNTSFIASYKSETEKLRLKVKVRAGT